MEGGSPRSERVKSHEWFDLNFIDIRHWIPTDFETRIVNPEYDITQVISEREDSVDPYAASFPKF